MGKSIKIAGAGLCGALVRRELEILSSETGQSLDVQSILVQAGELIPSPLVQKLNIGWRQEAIIGAVHPRGLSAYYHGVTPMDKFVGDDLLNAAYRHRFRFPAGFEGTSYSFVPWFPYRPPVSIDARIEFDHFKSGFENSYLCMSVVGNLQALQLLDVLQEPILVGDHIVVKLGSVHPCDLIDVMGPLHRLTAFGPIFRHFDLPEGRLFFRPDLPGSTSVNFAGSTDGYVRFIARNLSINKVRLFLYNKFSFPRAARRYAVIGQIPIHSSYEVYRNTVVACPGAEEKASLLIQALQNHAADIMESFVPYHPKRHEILPGIHLYYDRNLLGEYENKVFDTSLCSDRLSHPSVVSALTATAKVRSAMMSA